jgi:hypothetical protein
VPANLNALKFAPLNICNLPPIDNDCPTAAPPVATIAPVVVLVELSAELNVALPEFAPIDNVVAAPNALIFVAVVLKTLKVALPVVTLVVKSGDVAKTRAPDPVSPVIVLRSSDEVVAAKSDNLLDVVAKVPVVGTVTFVVFEVVNVKLCPPEVIKEEPFDKVKVALVAGAVIATLLYELAVTAPLLCITPEIEDGVAVPVNNEPPIPTPPLTTKAPEFVPILVVVFATIVVPPINAFALSPKPPYTINAPVCELDELVMLVTAKPETETLFVDGFTTKDVIVDRPKPVPLAALVVVTKNDWSTVTGKTATDEAAADGTA